MSKQVQSCLRNWHQMMVEHGNCHETYTENYEIGGRGNNQRLLHLSYFAPLLKATNEPVNVQGYLAITQKPAHGVARKRYRCPVLTPTDWPEVPKAATCSRLNLWSPTG